MLVVAALMSLAGAVWAARLMTEEGIPVRYIVLAVLFPALFIPGLLLTSMLSDPSTYRGPLFCQLRAALLIFVMILGGNIAAAREKAANDANFQRNLQAARNHAAQSAPASAPGK
jgi:hypothetical protein